ncbi:hypothetical protein F4780DRAFT_205338 [Xylariomycetidae sp. FL0641]|nr:hypothetical protein F4780DRAFT_205338 [Xylariomycetidae sp. FL0641]
MDHSGSTAEPVDGDTRPRKGKNSEIRKEQNRTASRAYREKRKQKLALLDELLKSEQGPESMGSPSDDTGSVRSTLSVPSSRQASHSPGPRTVTQAVGPADWVPSMQYVGNGDEYWMNYFEHPRDERDAGSSLGYQHTFLPPAMVQGPLENSGHLRPMNSAPVSPMVPPAPINHGMGDSHSIQQAPVAAMVGNTPGPGYQDMSGDTLDQDMANALESMSRLSYPQRQHVMSVLQSHASPSHSASYDPTSALGYTDYYTASPVSGVRSSPAPYRHR